MPWIFSALFSVSSFCTVLYFRIYLGFAFHTSILQRTSQCQAQRADSRGTCTFRYTLSFVHCGSDQCNSFFKQSSGNCSHILCNNFCSPGNPKRQYGFLFLVLPALLPFSSHRTFLNEAFLEQDVPGIGFIRPGYFLSKKATALIGHLVVMALHPGKLLSTHVIVVKPEHHPIQRICDVMMRQKGPSLRNAKNCSSTPSWTRPNANYAKDWMDLIEPFLFPGLVWSVKGFHFRWSLGGSPQLLN